MSKYEARIESLRADHEKVHDLIDGAQKQPGHCQIMIRGWKSEKLFLKDEIARLEALESDEDSADAAAPLEVLDGDAVSPTIELPIGGKKSVAA